MYGIIKVMEMDEYQKKAKKYDTGEAGGGLMSVAFMEKVLGLAGEAGEAVDKVKKILRDHSGEISEADREGLIKELGDTLWYIASVARYLDEPLSRVAEGNLAKLESRYQRGKLHGAGDER